MGKVFHLLLESPVGHDMLQGLGLGDKVNSPWRVKPFPFHRPAWKGGEPASQPCLVLWPVLKLHLSQFKLIWWLNLYSPHMLTACNTFTSLIWTLICITGLWGIERGCGVIVEVGDEAVDVLREGWWSSVHHDDQRNTELNFWKARLIAKVKVISASPPFLLVRSK